MRKYLSFLMALLCLLFTWSSCKKEIKQEIIPSDYSIKIISAGSATDTLGQLSSVPLEIKIYRGNDEVTPNPEDHVIGIDNLICSTAGTGAIAHADYGNDRMIRLRWYTGNTAGNQRVMISLKDKQGNILARAETSRTVVESASTWKATCKNDNAMLLAMGGKFWAVGEEQVMTSNDGITWIPGSFPERGSVPDENINPLQFNADKNGILFTTTKPDWSNGVLVFRSQDNGETWKNIFSLGSGRLLAVLDQEELVISGGQLYVMYKNSDGYTSGKLLINSNNFTSFLEHKSRFYALDLANLYSAETLTGNYTQLDTKSDIQYMWADEQDMYLFGRNKIYKMAADGVTSSMVSTLPVNGESTVLKVVRAKGRYYIAYKKSTSVLNSNSYCYMVSTTDWTNFSPETKIKTSPQFIANMVALKDGPCLIQQAEGFYHVQ